MPNLYRLPSKKIIALRSESAANVAKLRASTPPSRNPPFSHSFPYSRTLSALSQALSIESQKFPLVDKNRG
jgi:hypothetical protein